MNGNNGNANNNVNKETFVSNSSNVKPKEKLRFKYSCYDSKGKTVKGFFDAYRKSDVETFLAGQNYKIIEIKEVKKSKFSSIFKYDNEMKYKDLVFFLTQLSTYIKSGIPLTDSIKILENQTKDKSKKSIYQKIYYELSTGSNFSEALIKQGNTFPRLLVNMLKTSELTGNLTEALDDMAAYYKTADTNRKQIISALTYPSVVLVISTMVLTFLLIFIVPKFQGIFNTLGTNLPGITVFLINLSNFLKNNIIKIIIIFISLIIIIVFSYKNFRQVRYFVQYLAMITPIIKDVIIYNEVIIFTKTFSSLIKHDVFITDSIEILGKITNNEIYKGIIKEAVTNLSTGVGLSKAFENKWAFPRIAYEMLVTGEKTGRLGIMMENVANYYEEEQSNLVSRLKSLIEPIMIILLSVIVGVILMAIFVPMFKMYGGIL